MLQDLETAAHPTPYDTPAAIGGQPAATPQGAGRKGKASGGGDIWKEGEVSEQQQYEYDDPRPQPE